MRLNPFEKVLMKNPIHLVRQRQLEARVLKRLGGRMHGGSAHEMDMAVESELVSPEKSSVPTGFKHSI